MPSTKLIVSTDLRLCTHHTNSGAAQHSVARTCCLPRRSPMTGPSRPYQGQWRICVLCARLGVAQHWSRRARSSHSLLCNIGSELRGASPSRTALSCRSAMAPISQPQQIKAAVGATCSISRPWKAAQCHEATCGRHWASAHPPGSYGLRPIRLTCVNDFSSAVCIWNPGAAEWLASFELRNS